MPLYELVCALVFFMGGSIHWTGPLDWTTGLTFDPKILIRNGHFALIGSARMLAVMFLLWSGRY